MEAEIKIKLRYSLFSLQKRLIAFVLLVAFLFLLVFVRLLVLQGLNTKNYQILASPQWVRTLPLKAKRGKILDSNGGTLAASYTTYDLYVRAKEVENKEEVAKYLSSILGLNYESVYKKVSNVGVSDSLIKLQVDSKMANTINLQNFSGVYFAENISRIYPYKNSVCQVLGFLTSDSIGQTGVEKFYNSYLSGTNGKILTQSDAGGITLDNSLTYYIKAIDGMDIQLNLDINIQVICENALSKVIEEQKPKSASVIVMDPASSKIIALALSPSFDLNSPPRDDVQSLLSYSKNTAVSDVYEPGSTFKILTLASALSEGLTNENEHFYCPGYRIIDGEKIKCWKTTGHGSQTLAECVQNSCNCCFMDLAQRLGVKKLYSYLRSFGIGEKSGVDIAGESGGILLDEENVKMVDLVRIGFGQSVAVSALQLLNAFCSAINGGFLCVPQVLSSILSDGKILQNNQPIIKNKTLSQEVSSAVRSLLEKSLSKAGDMSFVTGYRIGGKTGTAQKYGLDGKIAQGKYVSSFFGFLNSSDSPRYAILLCVDEPSNGAYYGSVVAKPYAKEIFEGIISYKNLPKDDKTIEKEWVVVGNYIGLSLTQALVSLDREKISYEVDGEGSFVTGQFPSPGEKVSKSATILIKTN